MWNLDEETLAPPIKVSLPDIVQVHSFGQMAAVAKSLI
jgi:hypothetical protein